MISESFSVRNCYKQWKPDMLAKAEWIKVCVNDEERQRRRTLRDRDLIYPGDEFDIGECGSRCWLVPAKEYYGELD